MVDYTFDDYKTIGLGEVCTSMGAFSEIEFLDENRAIVFTYYDDSHKRGRKYMGLNGASFSSRLPNKTQQHGTEFNS